MLKKSGYELYNILKAKWQMLITIKDSVNDQVGIQQMLSAIKVINWKSFTVSTCICSGKYYELTWISFYDKSDYPWFKKESQCYLNAEKTGAIPDMVKEILGLYS